MISDPRVRRERDTPLAYLFTFRSYGTWLHGDERGSTDRFHNRYQTPHLSPSEVRHSHDRRLLKGKPFLLDARQRRSVEWALREVCDHRRWALHAINVRTNHIHLVIGIGDGSAGRALNDRKAYATRRLRRDGLWRAAHSPWADRGSKRYLWSHRSLALAVDYVINGQGDELVDLTE
jgi:REP element-mobilizing transposase RayT